MISYPMADFVLASNSSYRYEIRRTGISSKLVSNFSLSGEKNLVIEFLYFCFTMEDDPNSEIVRKMSTSEKRYKKRQKSGMSAFYLSGSAFLPISPLGNEKKRTF